nr:EOG090X0971 [Ilyocryptus agilis]
MSVILETTKGDLTIDLYVKERPKTCLNFLKLCKMKSYNLNRFHHVERNFLCQTGDPTGTGRGGESIYGVLYGEQARFYEAEHFPVLKHTKPGLLSMVNVGDNMLGSQFFITLGENLDYLDKEHCVFGEVVEGHDALLNINDAICDENNIPYQDIRITHAVILDDPFNDPPGLLVPSRSPEPSTDMVESGRIAADEDINEMEGKTAEEIEEMIAEREARARATILEMVGDIPDVDAAPPENVLFVCKLNPITTDEDLTIIFSRFGKIVNCEIIRDRQTGNSLQYAFIEFDNPKSCEEAYFKMDNVLIDDRRIHVDFSQSVSKLQYKGKGRIVVHDDYAPADHEKAGTKMRTQYRNDKSRKRREDEFEVRQPDRNSRDYRRSDYSPGRPSSDRDRNGKKSSDRSHRSDHSGRREHDHRRGRGEYNESLSRDQERHSDHRRREEESHRHRSRDDRARYEDAHSRSDKRHSDRREKTTDGHSSDKTKRRRRSSSSTSSTDKQDRRKKLDKTERVKMR